MGVEEHKAWPFLCYKLTKRSDIIVMDRFFCALFQKSCLLHLICFFVSINDHHDVGTLYARGGKECSQLRQPTDGSMASEFCPLIFFLLIYITSCIHGLCAGDPSDLNEWLPCSSQAQSTCQLQSAFQLALWLLQKSTTTRIGTCRLLCWRCFDSEYWWLER